MIAKFVRSAADLANVVVLEETTESLVLEFKETIDWTVPPGTPNAGRVRADRQRELCRDVAQFANSDGGCLLIGVSERTDPKTQLKVATGFSPVADADRLVQWIEQSVRRFLVPATFQRDIVPTTVAGGVVVAVNVAPSLHTVALWNERSIEYLRRTSHGKAWMNPDEVERHLVNSTRSAKLGLEQAKAEAHSSDVVVAGGVWIRHRGNAHTDRWLPESIRLGELKEQWFQLRVGSYSAHVPYGVLREAWVGADGRLNLLLSVKLMLEKDNFTLEPY